MATNNQKSLWVKIIETVDKPLGFFVLALLIVETFLVSVLAVNKFANPNDFLIAVGFGVGMFMYVTGMVFWLVKNKPENLTFNQDAHLKQQKNRGPYGSNTKQVPDLSKLPPVEGDMKKQSL